MPSPPASIFPIDVTVVVLFPDTALIPSDPTVVIFPVEFTITARSPTAVSPMSCAMMLPIEVISAVFRLDSA